MDYLNLFINSLKESDRGKELDFLRPEHEEDKIKKEHLLFVQQTINNNPVENLGKINKICDALKEELVKINENNNLLLPILTTYIKREP